MSRLVFDGLIHTICLEDSAGKFINAWYANNLVAAKDEHGKKLELRFVPNGEYRILDPKVPHKHPGQMCKDAKTGQKIPVDSIDGSFGRFGIVRMEAFHCHWYKLFHRHTGVGVHSGRANTRHDSWNFATYGCIRTTDKAMQAITQHMLKDPLQLIIVKSNHEQNLKLQEQSVHQQ